MVVLNDNIFDLKPEALRKRKDRGGKSREALRIRKFEGRA